jgi:hypothetical protein
MQCVTESGHLWISVYGVIIQSPRTSQCGPRRAQPLRLKQTRATLVDWLACHKSDVGETNLGTGRFGCINWPRLEWVALSAVTRSGRIDTKALAVAAVAASNEYRCTMCAHRGVRSEGKENRGERSWRTC